MARYQTEHQTSSRILWSVRSTASVLGLLIVVLTIVFFAFSVLPSDPIRNALGINASEEAVSLLRKELGYDRPLLTRYFEFLSHAAFLDFGNSIHSRREVRVLLIEGLSITARNGFLALGVSATISLLLTSLARLTNGAVENGIMLICRILTSVPAIIVAIVSGVISYLFFGSLADGGSRALLSIIAALAVYPTCSLTEIGITEARRFQYMNFVMAARGFGMGKGMVFWRCYFPVILTGWIGQLSNIAAAIFVSSSIFEVVFSMPGLGGLLARSLAYNDLPVVQGLTVMTILGFLGIDAIFEQILLSRNASRIEEPTR